MMKDEGWMMKHEGFKLLRGFASRLTDERTDICECRVAFATEKYTIDLIKSLVVNLQHHKYRIVKKIS